MKIIAGEFGGRSLISPDHQTIHPMSQKMRGAIFSSLGDINGLSLLDAYSGSGAISFEAYSRGLSNITAIDKSYYSAKAFLTNKNILDIANSVNFKKMSIESWLKINHQKFDIIVADPPYDNVNSVTISLLANILKLKGILVLSWPTKKNLPDLNAIKIKQKKYGDSQLIFYQAKH